MTHRTGEVIADRYSLQRVLGRGAQGTTWLATDKTTGKDVALKEMPLGAAPDWSTVERFEREGRLLASLNHPSIPRFVAAFHTDSSVGPVFCLCQEYVPGDSVMTHIQRGQRWDEAALRAFAEDVLRILLHLQRTSPPIFHRDLKPQNLLLTPEGRVVLVDFGAALGRQHAPESMVSVAGTFGYMAPEQLKGQALPSTDLYGLGATLVHMASHRGPTQLPQQRLKINFRGHVRLGSAFLAFLDALLEPAHEDRPRDAAAALVLLQKPESTSAASQRVVLGALAALGVAVGVGYAGFFQSARHTAPPVQAQQATAEQSGETPVNLAVYCNDKDEFGARVSLFYTDTWSSQFCEKRTAELEQELDMLSYRNACKQADGYHRAIERVRSAHVFACRVGGNGQSMMEVALCCPTSLP